MAKSYALDKSGSVNWDSPINVIAAAWGLSAMFVVVFVACLIAALLYPAAPLAHNWVTLFSVAPMDSGLIWVEGVVASIAFGWLAATVFGLVYNRLAR